MKGNLMPYLRNLSILFPIAVLSWLTLTPKTLAANFEANPIETLTINSTIPLTPVLSSPLKNGVLYKFEVSGTFKPDFNIPNWVVDARFVTRNNFATQNDLDPNFYNFDFGLFSNTLGANNDNFLGQYQSNNVYSFEYLGIGNTVDFYVNDISKSSGIDNAGSYTVKIFSESVSQSVPEPSFLLGTLLTGCFGIGSLVKRKQLGN